MRNPPGKGSLSSFVLGKGLEDDPKCQRIDCAGVTDSCRGAARFGGVEARRPGNASSDKRACPDPSLVFISPVKNYCNLFSVSFSDRKV